MAKSIKKIADEIDRLVKEANPADGSSPLGPIVMLGNLVAREWETIRRSLTNGVLQSGERE